MEHVNLGVVLYEEDGPIARIILDWPERANARSSDMIHQFDECLRRAEAATTSRS
jgi:enoyl-CoA hydratase